MKIFICLLLMSGICYADQRVFYDSVTKTEILDVSGKKTIDQIKVEFGLSNVEMVIIKANESAHVENNKLVKYDYVQENQDIRDVEKAEKDVKKNKIKQKLGLTEADWKDLKDALR